MPPEIDTAQVKWDNAPQIDTAKVKWDDAPAPESDVPEWGEHSPILYGVYGAGKALADTAKNIPGSAINYGSDILKTLTSPMELLRGVKRTMSFKDDPEAFEGIKAKLRQDYGGIGELNQKIINDPVGFAADLSTVALPIGGKVLEPVQAAKAGVVKGIGKVIPEGMPESWYGKSLKALPTVSAEDRLAMAREGLSQGIPVSGKGLEKLQGNIDVMNNEFSSRIKQAKQAGTTINPQDIAKYIDNLDKEVYQFSPTNKFSEQLKTVKQDFLDKWGSKPIPIDEAQKMKSTIYRIYRDNYGELARTEVEAYKGLARGVKDEVVKIFPELEEVGQKEKRSLQLETALERTLNRLGNRDWLGIATPLHGGMAGTLTGSKPIGIATGVVMHIANNPRLRSEMAIQLYNAMEGKVPMGMVKSRLAAYQGSKILEPEDKGQQIDKLINQP
jgi:hypothetical protein